MSTITTRLGLTKPTEATDLVDVDVINANMDLLDSTAALGYVTTSTRPSTTVFAGRAAYETDTGLIVVSNGTSPASASWLYPGSVAQNKTNATRPTVVVAGELVRESDTGNLLVHNGSSPASGGWEQFRSNVRVFTSGTRPSSPTTFAGFAIRESDTHNLLIHNGSTPASGGWEHVSLPVVSSTANIVAPYTDQVVVQSSDHLLYRYNGSSWVAFAPSPFGSGVTVAGQDATAGTTTSTTYTDTLTSASTLSVNFTGPTSGKVKVSFGCEMAPTSAFDIYFVFRLSGASTVAASDTNAARVFSNNDYKPAAKSVLVSGLTVGGSYTATASHRTGGATGQYRTRWLMVEPTV